MTEQPQTNDIVDESSETPTQINRLKKALSKIHPQHIAIAASAVVAVVGIAAIARAEKRLNEVNTEPAVIEVVPEVVPDI